MLVAEGRIYTGCPSSTEGEIRTPCTCWTGVQPSFARVVEENGPRVAEYCMHQEGKDVKIRGDLSRQ